MTQVDYLEKVDQLRDASGQIDLEKVNFDILIQSLSKRFPRGVDPLEQISGVFQGMLFEEWRIESGESTEVLEKLVAAHPKIAKFAAEYFEHNVIFYAKIAETPSKELAEDAQKMATTVRSMLARDLLKKTRTDIENGL